MHELIIIDLLTMLIKGIEILSNISQTTASTPKKQYIMHLCNIPPIFLIRNYIIDYGKTILIWTVVKK
jgi:hypothetical protein